MKRLSNIEDYTERDDLWCVVMWISFKLCVQVSGAEVINSWWRENSPTDRTEGHAAAGASDAQTRTILQREISETRTHPTGNCSHQHHSLLSFFTLIRRQASPEPQAGVWLAEVTLFVPSLDVYEISGVRMSSALTCAEAFFTWSAQMKRDFISSC